MSNDRRKVLLIVNPCAGKTKSRTGTFDIVDRFSKNDYEFTIRTTTCQGDATNIVKRELDDHDMVVCCGGDGTLNETINGVMDMPRRAPIGYIPTGTTCDLATSLGIPTDVKQATDIIIKGHTNDYDIGLFNNRYFSYVASFGAFTKCSYATPQKLKNHFGHAAYVLAAAGDLKDIHGIQMRVEHDGGVIEGKFCFGGVSNSTSVGGFIKLNKDEVRLNDGKFELLLVRPVNPLTLFPTMLKVMKHQYDGERIILVRTNKVKITCAEEEITWTLDGEYGGKHKEVMIHVLERAVKICSTDNPLFIKYPDPEVTETAEPEATERRRLRKRKKQAASEEAEETASVQEEAPDAALTS